MIVLLAFLPLLTPLAPRSACPAQHPALTLGHTETLHSEILDEDRELFIYLPNGYSKEREYPLLVLLDGQSNMKLVAGMLHGLAETGAVPRTIIVGVGNTDRWRDLTPYPADGFPTSGGGRTFLAFLEEELLPYVDAKWSTTGYRILFGHSLGGLTAVQALAEIPDAFDAYVALSPSLEWADGKLLDDVQTLLDERERLGRQLFLALADERVERAYYDRLVAMLESEAPASLQWRSRSFEKGDDHGSIRATGGLAALRSIYRDWWLPSAQIVRMSPTELEAFLERASRKYETPRTLGMMEITNAGYYAIHDPATAERGFELFREAIERWPDDPYPYACLGEGLERAERLEEALDAMELALERIHNDRFGDPGYYESMTFRVRAKLGE